MSSAGWAAPVPVTSGQAAIWLAEQAGELGPAYHTCTVLRVHAGPGLDRLAAACREVVRRTAALRVRMEPDPATGEIGQWFSADPPEVTTGVAEAGVDPVTAAVVRPFQVDGGPLVRFAVLDRGAHQEIVLVAHHLVLDGACQLPLARRIGDCAGDGCPDQPESAYTGLVRVVRERERQALAGGAAFWQARLPDRYPEPFPERASGGTGPAPALGRVRVDRCLLAAVERTAAALGARPFHLLAAAVHRVLSGHLRPPPVMSVAASVRPREPAAAAIAGGFVTQVPLLVAERPAEPFAGLVRRCAPEWRAALRHRDFPFPELSAMARRRAGQPGASLNRVMLTYRQVPETVSWRAGGTRFVADPHRPYLRAKTDVSFRLLHHRDQLDCQVELSQRAATRLAASDLAAELVARLRAEVPAW
jgi:hypothetical protein